MEIEPNVKLSLMGYPFTFFGGDKPDVAFRFVSVTSHKFRLIGTMLEMNISPKNFPLTKTSSTRFVGSVFF